jgi:hypothetical protein
MLVHKVGSNSRLCIGVENPFVEWIPTTVGINQQKLHRGRISAAG